MPPEVVTLDGNVIRQNEEQKYLTDLWYEGQKFIKQVVGKDPFIVVSNGDAIEGNHHDEEQLTLKSPEAQIEAFCYFLRPLTKRAAATYVVQGTRTHTRDYENEVAFRLGAVSYKPHRPAFDRLHLRINGTHCVFRHHIQTTTSIAAEGGIPARAIAEEQAQAARAGYPIPQVLSAGHNHVFANYNDHRVRSVCGASWQLHTRFTHRVASASRNALGFHIFDFRGLPEGSIPNLHQFVTSPPAPEPFVH